MNREEARKVAAICCTADNGCKSCVSGLHRWLNEAFPEHADIWAEAWTAWNAAGNPGAMDDTPPWEQ